MKRSIGANELSRLGLDQETIAIQIGVSQPLVSMWLSGAKLPGKDKRSAIQREFGINAEAWDMAPPREARKPKEHEHIQERHAPEGPIKPRRLGVFDEALCVMESVKKLRQWADDPENNVRPTEKAKVLEKCVSMLVKLGKQTGETGDISEQKLVKTVALQRVLELIFGALKTHPEALRDVDQVLQQVSE